MHPAMSVVKLQAVATTVLPFLTGVSPPYLTPNTGSMTVLLRGTALAAISLLEFKQAGELQVYWHCSSAPTFALLGQC